MQTPNMHRVVVHNGLVFVGGTVADDMSAGLEGQTEQILAKFDEYLRTAGTDKTRLLSATIFLTDLSRKAEMDAAWKRWLSQRISLRGPLWASLILAKILWSRS